MDCRPQGNPRSTSSDGVPPELEVLGLRRLPGAPVWPVCYTDLTGRRRDAAGVDHFDDLATRSSASERVTRFCINTWYIHSVISFPLPWLCQTYGWSIRRQRPCLVLESDEAALCLLHMLFSESTSTSPHVITHNCCLKGARQNAPVVTWH